MSTSPVTISSDGMYRVYLQGYSQAPGFDRATLNRIRSAPIRSCMGESLLIPSLLVNCTLSSVAKSPNQCCKLSLKSPDGSG